MTPTLTRMQPLPSINGITSTSLTLTGGIALNQVENDAQVAGIVDRTKGAVNSFGTDFKNTAAAAKILNDQATHNSTTWWAKAIKFATNNGTGIFLGDLFGATGFLKSFLGGGQTKAAPMH